MALVDGRDLPRRRSPVAEPPRSSEPFGHPPPRRVHPAPRHLLEDRCQKQTLPGRAQSRRHPQRPPKPSTLMRTAWLGGEPGLFATSRRAMREVERTEADVDRLACPAGRFSGDASRGLRGLDGEAVCDSLHCVIPNSDGANGRVRQTRQPVPLQDGSRLTQAGLCRVLSRHPRRPLPRCGVDLSRAERHLLVRR